MPHFGILREYKFEEVDDVRGAEVYGVNDEKLGTIDDVIFDHSTGEIRYIILKAGGLLSRKRVMIPADRIEPYGKEEDKFYAGLDKERLAMLPEFNENALRSESDWNSHVKGYEKCITGDPILYNQCTGRIITPPQEEVSPGRGPLSQEAKESLDRDLTPQRMGKQDDYLGVASGHSKTILEPKKPSIGGRKDVEQRPQQTTREVEGTMGTEFQVSNSPASSPTESIREPGVYRLDPVPESEQNTNVNQRPYESYGRRWMQFQQRLRERRDKVVSDCNLCGTQEKVA
ncbi:MAG TPA: PRC-barrel domain-containing protein [Candidatus Sulfotelmatobacter sp.]|nr:PRC-barrel domain-containing protein [Candidatus Sulfotelmatobacter sp.]